MEILWTDRGKRKNKNKQSIRGRLAVIMCFKVQCDECKKPTWRGCGRHVEQVLKDVPEAERCKCPRK